MNTQQAATQVHAATRAFFKNTHKSNNKRYADTAPISAAKRAKRAQGEAYTDVYRPLLQQYKTSNPGLTKLEYGRMLHQQGASAAGNCLEMSCVALYFFSQMAPGISVMLVHIPAPGDHVFLIAGGLPPAFQQPPYNQIRYLGKISAIADSWVVDVWAGICCRTSVYPAEFWHKTTRWGGQGKLVYFRGRWLNPASPDYTVPNLITSFRLFAPDSP